jgi:hypothetical protein
MLLEIFRKVNYVLLFQDIMWTVTGSEAAKEIIRNESKENSVPLSFDIVTYHYFNCNCHRKPSTS